MGALDEMGQGQIQRFFGFKPHLKRFSYEILPILYLSKGVVLKLIRSQHHLLRMEFYMTFEPPPHLTRVSRKQALAILHSARLMPDRFTAHRNGLFTARYLRGRELVFLSDEYESQLDSADKRVSIIKRPSPKLDRGRYITLQFTFAIFEN